MDCKTEMKLSQYSGHWMNQLNLHKAKCFHSLDLDFGVLAECLYFKETLFLAIKIKAFSHIYL